MLNGSLVALVTPFNSDGSINYLELENLIEYHINNNTDGIVILGTTGEASTISLEEQIEIVNFSVKLINKRVPVIIGAGSNDTYTAVKKASLFSNMGADYLLVVTPYYNKTNNEGLIKHYEAISDASVCPIILYNVPSRTGMSISVDVIKRLALNPKIIGIKEASGNLEYTKEISKYLSSDFVMYSGNDDIIVEMMELGAIGVISVLANIAPNETHKICKLCLEKKYDEARKIQSELLDVVSALFIETNPIPVKEALNFLGFNVGGYRLPLYPMELENKKKLFAILEEKRKMIK